jgi:parvulin-like peptidyl-prolyl isomerase
MPTKNSGRSSSRTNTRATSAVPAAPAPAAKPVRRTTATPKPEPSSPAPMPKLMAPTPEPMLPSPHRTANWRRITTFVIIGFVGAALLFVIGIGAGVYAESDMALVQRTASVLPYPAVITGKQVVRYNDLTEFNKALTTYFAALKDFNPNFSAPEPIDVKADALDELVRQQALKILSKRYNVNVSSLEIDEQMKKLVAQAGSEENVESAIKNLYGWSLEEYRERIIVPYLTRQHVQEQLSSDDALAVNKEAKQKADEALAKLEAGEDFAELAKASSEDTDSRAAGGDLGFIKRGDRDKTFEDAAFALEKGARSDVVRTPSGFVILLAVDKKTTAGATEDDAPTEEVQIRQILFRTADIDGELTNTLRDMKIVTMVRGLRWDSGTGHIVKK